jgi:hypothetical protein
MGSIDVHGALDTRSRRGLFQAAVALDYTVRGDKRRYSVVIPIKVAVKPSIAASHEILRLGEEWTNFELGPAPVCFRILHVEASDPYIRWELLDSRLGEECSSFRLNVRFDQSRVPYESSVTSSSPHWLQFTTDVPVEPSIKIPVEFTSDGDDS